jgi:Aminoglycoside-2''-adenylyltransferase
MEAESCHDSRAVEPGDYAHRWAWEPLLPADLAGLLNGLEASWWICGGWALDLYLGRETRRHDDLDVAVLRRDQGALFRHLRGWDVRYATPAHALEPWDGSHLEPPVHGIWARRSHEASAPWTCEFLLNEHTGRDWIFRRDEAVTRSLDEVGAERGGVPFLRPEIVLLYKAGELSPKNEADFAAVRPLLTATASQWLRDGLEVIDPRHPWVPQLHSRFISSA